MLFPAGPSQNCHSFSPQSATRVVLYYPGVCCPSISYVVREAKLSLLACVSASADQKLQERGLQLQFGNVAN